MRYRNLPLLFLASLLFSACDNDQDKFTVVGDITGMPEQMVYLEELDIINNNISVVDSTTTDGRFELKGKISQPNLYRLRPQIQSQDNPNVILLSIEGGTTKVSADWRTMHLYNIEGSAPSQSLKNCLQIYREHMRDLNTIGIILQDPKTKANDSIMQKAVMQEKSIRASFIRYLEQYADTSKYLPNAIFAVQILRTPVEEAFLSNFISTLSTRFPNNKMAADFTDYYNRKLAEIKQQQIELDNSPIAIGKPAPDITLPNTKGEPMSLSSFKGKYVLVDFWASWCVPCRAENPNVVSAYNKFKDKNFTILGVSLDNENDKWLAAIADDNLTWSHVSDLQGWQSLVVRTYQIQGIPANVLIDPQGSIIARNLRGADLHQKLTELLK